jgi:hypothetical protein
MRCLQITLVVTNTHVDPHIGNHTKVSLAPLMVSSKCALMLARCHIAADLSAAGHQGACRSVQQGATVAGAGREQDHAVED